VNRIKQIEDGTWWYWVPGFKMAGHSIPGKWVGPCDDEDEAEACLASYEADEEQARWERENPDELE
jgi:hypothetical protein